MKEEEISNEPEITETREEEPMEEEVKETEVSRNDRTTTKGF